MGPNPWAHATGTGASFLIAPRRQPPHHDRGGVVTPRPIPDGRPVGDARRAAAVAWLFLAAVAVVIVVLALAGCHAPRPGYGVLR